MSSSVPFQLSDSYHSYLVRLWKDNPHSAWRVAVQSVQSGETVHFADVEQFFAFVRAQMVLPPKSGLAQKTEGL